MPLLKLKSEQDGTDVEGWETLSCSASMLRGVVLFTLLSLLVFGSWAYQGRWLYRNLGELGAYAVWTVVFFGGIIVLFGRLCWWKAGRSKFGMLLGLAFLAYAVVWCLVWFTLKIPYADYPGGLLGMAAFCGVLSWGFGNKFPWLRMTLGAGLLSLAGYGLGAVLFEMMRHSNPAKLIWGLTYGIGFGAALGYASYTVQSMRISPLTHRDSAPAQSPPQSSEG